MGKLVVGELGRILWREQRESWWGILEDIEVRGFGLHGPIGSKSASNFLHVQHKRHCARGHFFILCHGRVPGFDLTHKSLYFSAHLADETQGFLGTYRFSALF